MLKSDSELQFLFPFRSSKPIRLRPRFLKARFCKTKFHCEFAYDGGGCASFSFSMNEKPGGLKSTTIPNYILYFRSVRQTDSFAPAVP